MVGTISFRPIEANLTVNDQDILGKMDPYVEFTIGDQTARSQVCSGGGNNPSWKDTVRVYSSGSPICFVRIKDKDTFFDDKLGTFEIDVADLESHGRVKKWYPIFNSKGQPTGELLLEAFFAVGTIPVMAPVYQTTEQTFGAPAQQESPVRQHVVESPVRQVPEESPVKQIPIESPVKQQPPTESPVKQVELVNVPVTSQSTYQTGPQSKAVSIPRPGGGETTTTVTQTQNQTQNQGQTTTTTTTTTYTTTTYAKSSGVPPVGTQSVYTGQPTQPVVQPYVQPYVQPVAVQQPVNTSQNALYNSQNVGYVSYIIEDYGDDDYAHEALMRGVDPYNTHNAILTNSQLSYGQRSQEIPITQSTVVQPQGQMAFGHGHNEANRVL